MVLPFQPRQVWGKCNMSTFSVSYDGLVDAVTCTVAIAQTEPFKDSGGNYLRCNAMWDTGALYTVVSKRVVAKLALAPIDSGIAYTVQGSYEAAVYLLDLMLPNRMLVKALRVSEGDFDDCDILIGMDVIRLGDFSVTNLNNTIFSFRIPSEGRSPMQNEHCIGANDFV